MAGLVLAFVATSVLLSYMSGVCVESFAGCSNTAAKRVPRLTVQFFTALVRGTPLDKECCLYEYSGKRLPVTRRSEANNVYYSQDLAAFAGVICGTSDEPTGEKF
jgi:ABC-type arginine/histidine transport system permease subunit